MAMLPLETVLAIYAYICYRCRVVTTALPRHVPRLATSRPPPCHDLWISLISRRQPYRCVFVENSSKFEVTTTKLIVCTHALVCGLVKTGHVFFYHNYYFV